MQYDFFQIIIPLVLIPILLFFYLRLRLKVLKKYQSSLLGQIEVLEKFNGEKVLTTNNYPQGVSVDQPSIKQSYWYKIAEQTSVFCQSRPSAKVLMLGLGANTISNLIARLNPQTKQTIIEIDSQIIQACEDFFGLKELPRHKLIKANVYQLAEQKNVFKEEFDVLIVDVFIGSPPYLSLKSNQPSFIEQLLPWLKKDGMIIFNRPAHIEQVRADGFQLKEYLNTLFEKTALFDIKDPRGFRNHVILGVKKK